MVVLSVSASLTNQELKCIIALNHTKMQYTTEAMEPKLKFCGPTLKEGTERIFTANAICRYISATTAHCLKEDDLIVDEWVEWEETTLEPLVAKLVKNGKDEVSLAALDALLTSVATSFKNKSFIVLNQLTIADIILGVTLRTALTFVKSSDIQSYVDQLFKIPAFVSSEQSSSTKNTKKDTTLTEKVSQGLSQDSVVDILHSICAKAVETAFPSIQQQISIGDIVRTKNPQHGEYQCNSAMSLFKQLKGQPNAPRSPRDVGQAIVSAMIENPVIAKMEIGGPGFINISLRKSFVVNRVKTVLEQGVQSTPCKKMKIAVDFSSPNIAKDMHVGHLRSTIIGDAMARILEFQGHEVVRINHVGDWGTQFGMLITYLVEHYPTWQEEMPDITDLTQLYKNAKKCFDEDEGFKKRSRDQVVLLQSGDDKAHKVWQVLCEISRREFQKVYNRLHVRLTEVGESFYNDKIPGVLEILKQKNLIEDSNGAQVVFTKKYKQPFMMVKGDGSYLYDSTDIAAIWYRLTQLKADWCIYYTDYTQNDHFGLFFEVARMAGILQDHHRVDHIGFGTVNDESGKRFKTRSGEVVRLVDLLDEAKERMKKQLLDRIDSGQTSLPMDEVDEAAERLGYGAIKYFDLRQTPTSNYIFSYDRMLATNGDTAVYLLFAYARLSSIVRKSGMDVNQLQEQYQIDPVDPSEWNLAIELLQFQDVLEFIKKDLMSNRLCSYLYTVAEKVQTFVTQCRVLGSPEQNNRLLLCKATMKVMHTCFTLLGIEPLDQI